ncbi:hypothetical protein ACTOB_004961 [Actinoplanes oblitus]|uniref:Uncharacterized protein n=1 Tax=Actinoplanes oblitus TaxID=3040509 RepID=A0ABY8W582_9ACTN|nr:hypothetical protein [Actinoplanes oblitus]WIM92996.1 hypothetical protein ACTOB_004961 [Actinoplanes oblitus]
MTIARIIRAGAAAVTATIGFLAATGSGAYASVTEFRHHDVVGIRQADYKITFYSDPYGNGRKHLIVADKRADGVTARLRIWPAPIASPCSYIDYKDQGGADDGAYHYDIYYPVGMIAYVYGSDVKVWGGTYSYDEPAILDNC